MQDLQTEHGNEVTSGAAAADPELQSERFRELPDDVLEQEYRAAMRRPLPEPTALRDEDAAEQRAEREALCARREALQAEKDRRVRMRTGESLLHECLNRQEPGPLEAVPDDVLEASERDLAEKVTALEATAKEAAELADRAEEAFNVTPSAETHSTFAVQRQIMLNARDEADELAAELAEQRAELSRREKVHRVDELAPIANAEALLSTAHQRMLQIVTTLRAQLEAESRWLAEQVEVRNLAAEERKALAHALDVPHSSQPLHLSSVHRELNDRLRRDLGGRRAITLDGHGGGFGGKYRLDLTVHVRFNEQMQRETEE